MSRPFEIPPVPDLLFDLVELKVECGLISLGASLLMYGTQGLLSAQGRDVSLCVRCFQVRRSHQGADHAPYYRVSPLFAESPEVRHA